MVTAKHHLYSLLADGWAQPSRAWIEAWNSGEVSNQLRHIFEECGFQDGLSRLHRLPGKLSYAEMTELYQTCFVIPDSRRILPVESIYKKWTALSGSTLSISGEKGYLMGDSAIHMKFLLDSLQIEIPSEFESMPDHLLLQLEFVSLLEEIGNPDFMTQFVQEHLDWLDLLAADAEEKRWDGFYLEWLRLTESCIRWDLTR